MRNQQNSGQITPQLLHELESSPLYASPIRHWSLRNKDGVAVYNLKGVMSVYRADLNRLRDSDGAITNNW